jgi:hypothetical protein
MKTEKATVGARGIDSLPYSQKGTSAQARALRASGIDFVVLYLGVVTPHILDDVLDAGLAFMPVTLAGRYDGSATVNACKALGLPAGCTVWLDLEGMPSFQTSPQDLMAKIDAWAAAVIAANYQPGLYVGAPQPLTGDELYRLKVVRYWKAPSRVIDRNGTAWDGPACGFCMYQCWPQGTWRDTGVLVDVDFIQQDFHGRLPSWVVA